MTTAVLEKRVSALEKEVQELRRNQPLQRTPWHLHPAVQVERAGGKSKLKKLPPGLRQALKEVREGKVSGPFRTVEELIADLES